MKKLIKKLSETHGSSGYENEVSKIIEKELKSCCDEIHRDKLGNLIAKKGSGSPVYMLAAHMDEIGFIVKHIDKNGYVWFVVTGGFYDPTIFGSKILIHTETRDVPGVIGSKPPHLMEEEERKKMTKWKELYIDVGAESKEEAQTLGIEIGQSITFNQQVVELAGNRLTGKSFDNRAGCAVMVETMKKLKNFKGTIYAVGTVQEEVGLKGAQVAAYKINPDLAIAIDVSLTGDSPSVKEREASTMLGKGPSITFAEAQGQGLIANPIINKWLTDTAKELDIPVQLEATFGGRTDAASIYITREGIPSASVGIPLRYMHTAVEVVDVDDMVALSKLLTGAIEKGIEI